MSKKILVWKAWWIFLEYFHSKSVLSSFQCEIYTKKSIVLEYDYMAHDPTLAFFTNGKETLRER